MHFFFLSFKEQKIVCVFVLSVMKRCSKKKKVLFHKKKNVEEKYFSNRDRETCFPGVHWS